MSAGCAFGNQSLTKSIAVCFIDRFTTIAMPRLFVHRLWLKPIP